MTDRGRRPLGADGRLPVGLRQRPAERERQPRRHGAPTTAAALVFRDQGTLPHPNAERHDYAALVGSDRRPASGVTGAATAATRATTSAPRRSRRASATTARSATAAAVSCATTSACPARGSETLWVGVAGSDEGLGTARGELDDALRDPERALRRKVDEREELADWTQLSLPGDQRLQAGIDWGKQNLADSTQAAEDLEIRHVDEGRAYPRPAGRVDHVRFRGAGWPDYPWIFGTDGEYTAFASVALGQFEPTMDHMRALRDVSEIANDGSRQARARDRHRRLDLVRRQRATRATPTRPSSSRASSRCCGAGPATTASATTCTLHEAQPALRRRRARRRRRRLARGPRQRRARGHGPGEARQQRLLHPRPLRPRRHGRVQGRPRHGALGDRHRRRPVRALRGRVVDGRSEPARRLARRDRTRRSSRSTGSPARRWTPS